MPKDTSVLRSCISNEFHTQDDVIPVTEEHGSGAVPEAVSSICSRFTTAPPIQCVTGDASSKECALLLDGGALSVDRRG